MKIPPIELRGLPAPASENPANTASASQASAEPSKSSAPSSLGRARRNDLIERLHVEVLLKQGRNLQEKGQGCEFSKPFEKLHHIFIAVKAQGHSDEEAIQFIQQKKEVLKVVLNEIAEKIPEFKNAASSPTYWKYGGLSELRKSWYTRSEWQLLLQLVQPYQEFFKTGVLKQATPSAGSSSRQEDDKSSSVSLLKDAFYIRGLRDIDKHTVQWELEGNPVSATFVTAGAYFGLFRDTGLIYSKETVSLISGKGDIQAPAQLHGNPFHKRLEYKKIMESSEPNKNARLAQFMKNEMEKRYGKRHKLFTDINLAVSKYYEMTERGNKRAPDIRSKFLIIRLLAEHVPAFDPSNIQPFSVYKDALLSRLTEHEFELIKVALVKLDQMSPSDQEKYLKKAVHDKATQGERQRPLYSQHCWEHNEHILLPTKQNVIGVYISGRESDKALKLQRRYCELTGISLPFYTYNYKTGKMTFISSDEALEMARK